MRVSGVVVGVVLAWLLAGAAPAGAWEPGPAQFGTTTESNVPVTMRDGTVLRANVTRPTDPATGKAAAGPFPVILTQTPYGKGSTAGAGAQLSALGGQSDYLVKRGYIQVVADVRGTGDSQGAFDLFEPVQAQDGVQLVDWAATLPGSSGKVGTLGASYLGIIQLLTAAQVGKDSPLKAVFPIIPANEVYRDTAFGGGMLDLEFSTFFLGLTGALNVLNPVISGLDDVAGLLGVEADHAGGLLGWHLQLVANVLTGGDQAYDEAYWQARSPVSTLKQVADNGIPAMVVGGWYDLFQRGEPLDYSGLQNAYRGRDVLAPMGRNQVPTGRYQLVMGPWYHVTAGQDYPLDELELRWFDRWLKGAANGIAREKEPMQLYDLGTKSWKRTGRYPLDSATPTRYYAGAGGTLSTTAPTAGSGADAIAWTGLSQPCNRSSEQWAAGLTTLVVQSAGLKEQPCTTDNRLSEAGPGAVSYTTDAFKDPTVVAGPVGATLYASSSAKDAELIATLSDVAPDGSSSALTSGALLGSHRALDAARSWPGAGDSSILPYHPYTRAAKSLLTPGQVTRFDVEVFPTFATLQPGHKLRLTITTSDTPHLLPTPPDLVNLAGGVYQVQRTAAAPSHVTVPLAPASAFGTNTAPAAKVAVKRRAGKRVRLSAAGSRDADGRIASVRWTLGKRVLSKRRTFTRRFTRKRTVVLRLTDNRGAVTTRRVVVRPRG